MDWLVRFANEAEATDTFKGNSSHTIYLLTGLFGEIGSLLAEFKKETRESGHYPRLQLKIREELGDSLWYFTRLMSELYPNAVNELNILDKSIEESSDKLQVILKLSSSVGELSQSIRLKDGSAKKYLRNIWESLCELSRITGLSLESSANFNLIKIKSRWPIKQERNYTPLFDNEFPENEQIPRLLNIEFRELPGSSKASVILRCNGLNIGDRLTDNIQEPDGYRFHDIFHLSYAAFLGWSPVLRALLKCKRKSNSSIDEGEDGARAAIIEEAISATIYSYSKELNYFQDQLSLEYNLLKTVQSFTSGFEISSVPLWQWEEAILEGFRVYRLLKENKGGFVKMDLINRKLDYFVPNFNK